MNTHAESSRLSVPVRNAVVSRMRDIATLEASLNNYCTPSLRIDTNKFEQLVTELAKHVVPNGDELHFDRIGADIVGKMILRLGQKLKNDSCRLLTIEDRHAVSHLSENVVSECYRQALDLNTPPRDPRFNFACLHIATGIICMVGEKLYRGELGPIMATRLYDTMAKHGTFRETVALVVPPSLDKQVVIEQMVVAYIGAPEVHDEWCAQALLKSAQCLIPPSPKRKAIICEHLTRVAEVITFKGQQYSYARRVFAQFGVSLPTLQLRPCRGRVRASVTCSHTTVTPACERHPRVTFQHNG